VARTRTLLSLEILALLITLRRECLVQEARYDLFIKHFKVFLSRNSLFTWLHFFLFNLMSYDFIHQTLILCGCSSELGTGMPLSLNLLDSWNSSGEAAGFYDEASIMLAPILFSGFSFIRLGHRVDATKFKS
jgi:hypothetical protein